MVCLHAGSHPIPVPLHLPLINLWMARGGKVDSCCFLQLSFSTVRVCNSEQERGERVSMSVSPPCFPPSCCLGEHKAIIKTLLTFSPFDWTSPKGCRYPRTLFKSLPPGRGLQARLALFLSVVQVLQRGRWAAGTFVSVNLNIPPTTSRRADAGAFQRRGVCKGRWGSRHFREGRDGADAGNNGSPGLCNSEPCAPVHSPPLTFPNWTKQWNGGNAEV